MSDNWSYHFSPSPSTSSTRSSHLSVLTTASSVTSPPASPTASKTYAFFASPFSGDTPQPPPNPHARSSSEKYESSEVSADDTPRVPPLVPKRSLNEEFFRPSLLPTPPPSIRSVSQVKSAAGSRDNSVSPPRFRIPPLSRLFPSRARYGSESDDGSSLHGTNVRRDLVHLDAGAPHGHPDRLHSGEQTESPVESHHLQLPPSLPTPTPADRDDSDGQSYIAPPDSSATSSQRPPTPPLSDPELILKPQLEPGLILSSSSLSLELVKLLGTGSFSGVWLARDVGSQLTALELVRKSSLARSKSLRGRRSRTIDGTRPARRRKNLYASDVLSPKDEQPGLITKNTQHGRLVAVKMTERAMCDSNSRSRVSFVREVEVLRHISHPSIVSYLHSFSTPSHHCLVLEHVGGGELLELVDDPVSHARIDEPLVRRIWGELCRAVAWMHSVGLVHRDIKLENILLTTDPFMQPLPSQSLIKLTDFGLSRFVDPEQPMLTTLCGSDSYAAPELVMGKPYDGRETDVWACGVVLYALATRRLPFDPPNSTGAIPHDHPDYPEADWEVQRRKRAERRGLLNRIAQGEYSWPDTPIEATESGALKGLALAQSEGIRRTVAHLLVRNHRKRSRIADLWIDEWMREEGAPPPPILDGTYASSEPPSSPLPLEDDDVLPITVNGVDGTEFEVLHSELVADVDADDEGVLVDGEDIVPGSVACQEH